MKRLESVISAYWEVGTALRHPESKAVSTERALKLLNQSIRLNPVAEEMRLSESMHTLKYDIIEGSTEWRSNERQKVQNSRLIQFTRR